jgi:uncharacterized phage protein (TIGR02220 family)
VRLYKIANWEALFETYETKKLAHLKWVPVPNKHDGLGFRRVASQKNRCELFAAWNLILQVASKGRKATDRGLLQRGGKPLTPDDLAIMTGFPASIFESALEFFSSPRMGWLSVEAQEPTEKTAEPPVKTAESSEETCAPPAEGKGIEGKEENGTEQKEGSGCAASAILQFLNVEAGRDFRKTDGNLDLINARLEEVGGDDAGIKTMIARQCAQWKGDPVMDEFLRPETLFRKSKFASYYDNRNLPVLALKKLGTPPARPPTITELKTQRDALEAELNGLRNKHGEGPLAKPWSEADRQRRDELKKRIGEIGAQIRGIQ